jgi:hypothetical protein
MKRTTVKKQLKLNPEKIRVLVRPLDADALRRAVGGGTHTCIPTSLSD